MRYWKGDINFSTLEEDKSELSQACLILSKALEGFAQAFFSARSYVHTAINRATICSTVVVWKTFLSIFSGAV